MTTFITIIAACTGVGVALIVALTIAIFNQDRIEEKEPKPFYSLIVDTKLSLEY